MLVWWLQAASVSLKALDRPEPSPPWGSCSPAVVSTSCHYSLHLEQDLRWCLATEPGHDTWMEGYPIGSLHAECGCNNPIRLSPVWEFPWDVPREKQRPCLVAQSLKQSCSDDEAHSSFPWGLLCMWPYPQAGTQSDGSEAGFSNLEVSLYVLTVTLWPKSKLQRACPMCWVSVSSYTRENNSPVNKAVCCKAGDLLLRMR